MVVSTDTGNSPAAFPQLRIWLCGPFRMAWIDITSGAALPPSDASTGGRDWAAAIFLLALLLRQPNRQAHRDWIMEQFWPEGSRSVAVHRLENIFSALRKLLRPPSGGESLLHSISGKKSSGPSYCLAAYPKLWVDTDAVIWNVEQACRMERFGDDALPFWERAFVLAKSGPFLVDEPYEPYATWVTEQREYLQGYARQCVHALARLYLAKYGEAGKAEALLLLRTCWQQHKTDEDALRPLLELLGEQECYQEAEEYYQQYLAALAELGLDEEGQPRTPDARTCDIREYLRTKQIQRERSLMYSAKENKLLASSPSLALTRQREALAPFSNSSSQGILEADRILEGNIMDQLRRQLLVQTLKGTGVAIFASQDIALHSEIAERLAQALTRPSSIDEKTLVYLERRVETYWQDRNDVALPAWNLLPYVIEDLQKITALLEGSLRPAVRTHLCSIAGAAAMLIGELHYDMSNYAQARSFQKIAITAAYEADNAALEAVAWGRNSFAWTYDGGLVEARNSIQQTHRLAWSVNSTVRAWLAAVEAEIHAHLGDREACLKALKGAANVEDGKHRPKDNYWIHFDQSLFAGYQGVSFLRLSSSGHQDLMQNAQTALQDALDLLDPSMKRRQPTLFVDLAGTYVQQQNIEQACGCAVKAVDIATQINSKVSVQRLLALRDTLEPWKETRYVQDLDKAIGPLLTSRGREEVI
jgi:DNA-binding SARP family transcriptional activator